MQVLQVDLGAVHRLYLENHPDEPHSKLSTYIDLAMELTSAYRDFRPAEREPLTEVEQFWALTGESPTSLREGRLLTVKVVWVQAETAGLKTDTGVCLSPQSHCAWQRRPCWQCTCMCERMMS